MARFPLAVRPPALLRPLWIDPLLVLRLRLLPLALALALAPGCRCGTGGLGEDCSANEDCDLGLYCDPVTLVCVAVATDSATPPSDGGPGGDAGSDATPPGTDAGPTPTCGDGALDLAIGEECDDGNTTAGDGCDPTCQFEPVGAACGNGALDALEVCDDGNTANGDACNPTCNLENDVTLFAGMAGNAALIDGIGGAAALGGQTNLAVDATYLWAADSGNNVIRRIEIATADVVTVAGDPAGAPGLADDPSNGLLALFSAPGAVTTDGFTVWIADQGRIRAMDASPPFGVTTVAGPGPGGYADGAGTAAGFDDLRGLTYYGGYVWALDANAATVRRFDPLTADVTTVAGTPYTTGCPALGGAPADGTGSAAVFCSPRYIANDGNGILFIGDTNGNTIRTYDTASAYVGTFAGTGACGYVDGTGIAAAVHRPRGMTSDGSSLYWVEFNAHTIRQGIIATGVVTTLAGMPAACTIGCTCGMTPPAGGYTNAVGSMAAFANPWGIVYHYPSSSLFVADGGNSVIRRID